MTRNEFIAGFVMRRSETPGNDAVTAADDLEKQGSAPWLDVDKKDEQIKKLTEMLETVGSRISDARTMPPDFVPLAHFTVAPGGGSLAVLLAKLGKDFPENAGVPGGDWELGFRPAAPLAPPSILKPPSGWRPD